eukprot:Lankesteria_metandrocarpae@DN4653_c0_g1_i1.p1
MALKKETVTKTVGNSPSSSTETRDRAVVVMGGQTYVAAQPQIYQVWGFIPVEDKRTMKLTQTVLMLSILCGIMVLCSAIIKFVAGSWLWGALFLFFAIVLPLSGFHGAKQRNRQKLLTFAVVTCIFVVFLVVWMVYLMIFTISLASRSGSNGCKGSQFFVMNDVIYNCSQITMLCSVQIVLYFLEVVFYSACSYSAFELSKRLTRKVVVTEAQQPAAVVEPVPPVIYGQPNLIPLGPEPPFPV